MVLCSFTISALLLCGANTAVHAQRNIPVNETDTTITLNAADAPFRNYDSIGNSVGPPGFYHVASGSTELVAMSQEKNASATFKFIGSAIYINSLMSSDFPVYTVTLDGVAIDVDDYTDYHYLSSGDRPLWSQAGLDPAVEHEVTLATKNVSLLNNDTQEDGPPSQSQDAIFSLISFVYTATDGMNSSPSRAKSGASPTILIALGSDTEGAATILSILQVAFGVIVSVGVRQVSEVFKS